MSDEASVVAAARLDGQVALITGGGTGIGQSIAIQLADAGAVAVVASRKLENLQKTVAEIRARGGVAEAHVANIRERAEVDALIAWIVQTYGRIDILVNNAGGQFLAPILETPEKGWKAVVDLNLNGTFNCLQAAGGEMVRRRRGRIVNVITAASLGPAPGCAHSAAARAGVASLTQTAAVEWAAFGVRVNAVAPGPVLTPALQVELGATDPSSELEGLLSTVPIGRLGLGEDIAKAVHFLVSPAADFVTGQILAVDGGFSLGRNVVQPRQHDQLERRA